MSPPAAPPSVSPARLDQVLASAAAAGLLPATARPPQQDTRPWPVVLLTALGAWLAAVPLLGAVGLFLGEWMRQGAAAYLVAATVLGLAVTGLRRRDLPLFLEQLAVPALLVGGGLLAYALTRDLPQREALVLMALLAAGLGASIPRPWIRVLLGAVAAVLTALACVPMQWLPGQPLPFWWAWHLCLACWLAALAWQHRLLAVQTPLVRWAAVLEPFAAGWGLATLAGLAWWSGMTFLVGASLGGGWFGAVAQELARPGGAGAALAPPMLSAVLMGAAALWWARCWPGLRRPWIAGLAAVGLALAWFLPALGGVALILACGASRAQWRLAGAAAVAAAWILGSFYYALQWPLATKAGVLVLAGLVLGAAAAAARRGMSRPAQPAPAAAPRRRAGIALSAVAVLAVANIGIWQKEDLIAHGQPVYVALAPVDPRSLMQGDYMQLSFRLPDDVQVGPEGMLAAQRPCVVARRDARGVATLLRLDTGAALAADELRVELTPKNGRWVLVTDAWFFKEGDAERWTRARFGEFRVDAAGRALLVGLRGADLQAL
ncbi:MAG TPA: GDYXXLXY domain-containing protein [Burkholderiaceae bacterium]|nr:GDYXXLXY domain-containing protein [Burkholderiaceae bacterium]